MKAFNINLYVTLGLFLLPSNVFQINFVKIPADHTLYEFIMTVIKVKRSIALSTGIVNNGI